MHATGWPASLQGSWPSWGRTTNTGPCPQQRERVANIGADRTAVLLRPSEYGRIGHYDLFHDSHARRFWRDTLIWHPTGQNPWPKSIA